MRLWDETLVFLPVAGIGAVMYEDRREGTGSMVNFYKLSASFPRKCSAESPACIRLQRSYGRIKLKPTRLHGQKIRDNLISDSGSTEP
jgi:hypothetical protein